MNFSYHAPDTEAVSEIDFAALNAETSDDERSSEQWVKNKVKIIIKFN